MHVFIALVLVLIAPLSVNAQSAKCVGGVQSHPATAAEAAAATDGSIIAGVTQVCPTDAAVGISADAGSAKEYLYSISTKTNTADKYHISQLNSTFAVCAAAYAKAYTQAFGETLQITSAWRSAEDQKRVSTSPTSNHTRGLAIDIHPASRSQASYDRMMNFAAQNKQFGVCFARPSYNGSPDRPHMTAAGIGSNTENCAKYGITQMCKEGGTFDPNQVNTDTPTGPVQQTPTGAVSDLLKQYLGGSQQQGQPTQQPSTIAAPASNSIPASSQPFSASQPSTIATPAASGVSTNAGVTTSATPATIATPVTNSTGNISTPVNVSEQLPTVTRTASGTTTSALDLIASIASPTTYTVATTAVGAPLALNNDLYADTGDIETNPRVETDLHNLAAEATTLGPAGQQTFTSSDLQFSQGDRGSQTLVTQSTLSKTLALLKLALTKLLALVKPFGTRGTALEIQSSEMVE